MIKTALTREAAECEAVSQDSLMSGVEKFTEHLEYAMMLKMKSFACYLAEYQSHRGKFTKPEKRMLERDMLLPAGRFCVLFDLYASLLRMEENMGIPAALRLIKVCENAKAKLKKTFLEKGYLTSGHSILKGLMVPSFEAFIDDIMSFSRRREIDICSELWVNRNELAKAVAEIAGKEVM